MLDRKVSMPAVLRALRSADGMTIAKQAIAVVNELEEIESAILLAEMEDNAIGKMHTKPRPSERKAALKQYLKSGANRRRVFDAFVSAAPEDYTPFEVAAITSMYNYTAAPRCTELKDRGILEETGEMRKFRNHDPAMVLRLTSKGRGIARSMIRQGW